MVMNAPEIRSSCVWHEARGICASVHIDTTVLETPTGYSALMFVSPPVVFRNLTLVDFEMRFSHGLDSSDTWQAVLPLSGNGFNACPLQYCDLLAMSNDQKVQFELRPVGSEEWQTHELFTVDKSMDLRRIKHGYNYADQSEYSFAGNRAKIPGVALLDYAMPQGNLAVAAALVDLRDTGGSIGRPVTSRSVADSFAFRVENPFSVQNALRQPITIQVFCEDVSWKETITIPPGEAQPLTGVPMGPDFTIAFKFPAEDQTHSGHAHPEDHEFSEPLVFSPSQRVWPKQQVLTKDLALAAAGKLSVAIDPPNPQQMGFTHEVA